MKKFVFFLFLMSILSGCGGGGGRSDPPVTIVLRGSLTLGAAQGGLGGGGNPAPSGVVKVTELNKSATITNSNNGLYSITDVPVGGNYTVDVTDPQGTQVFHVVCGISIPDSTNMTINSQSGGTCVRGSGNIGELVLDITTD